MVARGERREAECTLPGLVEPRPTLENETERCSVHTTSGSPSRRFGPHGEAGGLRGESERLSSGLLILFDIDATMVLTSRSGLWAMERAGRELFGDCFAIGDIEFAGRLDSLIIPELFERCGVAVTASNMAAYGDLYARLLDERLADPAVVKTVLPGVRELLDEIEKRAAAGVDVTLGLLTGNYERTGKAKLAACGIDPGRFAVGAFAEDASPWGVPGRQGSRDDLPPVAMSRYAARFGRAVAPERTVVIGDSPYDVRCAKVNGCRSLAVATGVHTVEQLRGCVPQGADLAVASLADTGRVLEWVFGR